MVAEALAEFSLHRLTFCGGYDIKNIIEQEPCIDKGIAQSFNFIESDDLILKATVLSIRDLVNSVVS